jgi:hypothetical protein
MAPCRALGAACNQAFGCGHGRDALQHGVQFDVRAGCSLERTERARQVLRARRRQRMHVPLSRQGADELHLDRHQTRRPSRAAEERRLDDTRLGRLDDRARRRVIPEGAHRGDAAALGDDPGHSHALLARVDADRQRRGGIRPEPLVTEVRAVDAAHLTKPCRGLDEHGSDGHRLRQFDGDGVRSRGVDRRDDAWPILREPVVEGAQTPATLQDHVESVGGIPFEEAFREHERSPFERHRRGRSALRVRHAHRAGQRQRLSFSSWTTSVTRPWSASPCSSTMAGTRTTVDDRRTANIDEAACSDHSVAAGPAATTTCSAAPPTSNSRRSKRARAWIGTSANARSPYGGRTQQLQFCAGCRPHGTTVSVCIAGNRTGTPSSTDASRIACGRTSTATSFGRCTSSGRGCQRPAASVA